MNLKLVKAARDLSTNPKRTLLVVFAMILGIWGVGTVEVSYVILMNDLNANYQSTTPQQLVLTSNDFAKLNLADFVARPEIETAE